MAELTAPAVAVIPNVNPRWSAGVTSAMIALAAGIIPPAAMPKSPCNAIRCQAFVASAIGM